MPEILGPHFFSRIFKEESEKGGGGWPDAAPREEYLIDLLATGLGFSGGGNTGNDQREKVGSATCLITKTHFQKLKKNLVSCTIEQLNVNTGDTLTDMQAFAAILRRIQSLCFDNDAEHLAMIGSESFRVSSGLLEHVGFTLCDCEHPSRNVRVGSQSQLCMDLPARPTRSSVHKDQDHRMDSSSTRERDHVTAPANRTRAAKTTKTGDPSAKKIYCTHWIFTGECEFTQKGCKFKHEIPFDKETREKIGVGKIPDWFKQSPHWGPWLQQEAAQRFGLTRHGHNNAPFLAQPSSGPSDPRAQDHSSRGQGDATTQPRGPGNFGAYTVQSPYQNPYQDAVASNIKSEGSRVGPASATAIDSTNAISNRTTGRRRNRQSRHKRQGAPEPPVAVKREYESMDESSDVWGSGVEAQIGGAAKRPKLEFQHQ